MGKQCKQWQALFSGAPKSLQMATKAMGLKDTCSWNKSYDKPIQCIKKQRHHFADKVHLVKAMVFPVVMYGCGRRKWQPTPVFLPRESHGQRSLGGLLSMGSHRVRHDWRDLAYRDALEKEMATHSCILAWRILWTEELGGLLSTGSHRVGHD